MKEIMEFSEKSGFDFTNATIESFDAMMNKWVVSGRKFFENVMSMEAKDQMRLFGIKKP